MLITILQNINYYLEAIRREHLRRQWEIELHHPNKENVVNFTNLVKDLADWQIRSSSPNKGYVQETLRAKRKTFL